MAAAVCAVTLGGLVALAAPPTAVRVSGDGISDPHCGEPDQVRGYEVEPSLAADPSGSLLVGAWQQDRLSTAGHGSVANIIGISRDGGASWERELVIDVARCPGGWGTNISDPWVAIAPDGTIYVASLGVIAPSGNDPGRNAIFVQSSRDGGQSWSRVFVHGHNPDKGAWGDDKPTLAVDPAVPGRAWVVWNRERPAFVSRTDDFGESWGRARRVSRGALGEDVIDSHLLPLGPHRLVALYTTGRFVRTTELVMQVSRDHGDSWSKPRVLTWWDRFGLGDADGRYSFRADSEIFSAAAGPDGAGYVAIQADEGLTVLRTRDAGRRWTKRVVVDPRGGVGVPIVAASPDGHSVALTYISLAQDRKGDRQVTTRYRSAISRDRGKTWSDTPLTASFDSRRAKSGGDLFLGDYTGLAPLGSDGGFGALVVAARPLAEDGPTDVFFVRAGDGGDR